MLDEPFAAIDQRTESKLIEIIRKWRSENRTLIVVLHDLSTVMDISDYCLLLGDSRYLFGKTKEVITTENLLSYRYLTETEVDWISRLHNSGCQDV